MKINGTFRFKTTKELIETGWTFQNEMYKLSNEATVVKTMIGAFEGKVIDVINGRTNGWDITSGMVITDEYIIDKVLNKYLN